MPLFLPRGLTTLPMPLLVAGGLMVAASDGVGGGLEPADTGNTTPDSGEPDSTDSDSATGLDPRAAVTTPSTNPVGTFGDRAVLANIARSAFSLTGAGVTIGILSDSFNLRGGYAADIISGALPTNISVLSEGPAGGTDEGRAMAQLVHQIAPDAKLMFYSAFHSEADFANGITALSAAGANVIVDDVTYLDEPFFQPGGTIADAVANVVAGGVSYFTAASNEGSNYYESTFNGFTAPLPGLGGSYQTMNFGTPAAPLATQSIAITPGAAISIDLQWDQPFASIGSGHASANSLAMALYDDNNHIVATASINRTNGDPVQVLRFTNNGTASAFHLAIVTNGSSVAPHLFKYIVYGAGVTINDANAGKGSGTVIGHALTDGADSVGAIAALNAPTLGGNGVPEPFSAYGPGVLMFDALGNRIAAPIADRKVDFVAPDGVATSVLNPFYGTSAAAPHAAGVAALMLQADPGLPPAEMMIILEQTALPLAGSSAQWGAGLIQAPPAIARAIELRDPTYVPPAAAFGTAIPNPDVPGWIVVAAAPQPVSAGQPTPVQSALAALDRDPTAAGDFTVTFDDGTPATDPLMPLGTTYALLANAGAGPMAILPDPPSGYLPDWQHPLTG